MKWPEIRTSQEIYDEAFDQGILEVLADEILKLQREFARKLQSRGRSFTEIAGFMGITEEEARCWGANSDGKAPKSKAAQSLQNGKPTDWQDLAMTSHYQTAVAVEQALQRGDVPEAAVGIQELIDALSRSEKRALKSQLIRLMAHIIKWKSQPDKRSRSWRATIRNARCEIAESQEDTPDLTRQAIEAMWQNCFGRAKADAEDEMGQESTVAKLTWKEVFEKDYEVK